MAPGGASGRMSARMTHALTTFLSDHGILAVLLLMTVESCGIPFPSEVIMPFGGYLASQGHVSLAGVIVAGAAGNLIGSLIAYGLAARWGEPLLLGPGRWIGISRRHIEVADRWFQRHGLAAVLVGRVIPVVRTYISFPAGLARVDLVRFSVLTFAGALPWCAALAAAGYAVGASYDKISGPIEVVAIVVAVLVVGVVIGWIVRNRRRTTAA